MVRNIILFFLYFNLPIMIVLIGLTWFFFPPKKITKVFGFRTELSMKNQENWNFAHKYHSKGMIIFGFLSLMISFLCVYLFSYNFSLQIIVGIVNLCFNLISLFILGMITQNKLEKFSRKKE